MAEGLNYVHRQGLIHCDIKPENILLGIDYDNNIVNLKLADFGDVNFKDKKKRINSKGKIGTHGYEAPEALKM